MKNAYHKNQTDLQQLIKPQCIAAICDISRKSLNNITVTEPKTTRVKGETEKKTMNQTNNEREGTPITWDELQLGGNYVKFEKDVRTKIVITNWELLQKEGKKYESEETEMKTFFVADVVNQDGEKCDKTLSTSSKPFLVAIKKILEKISPKTHRLLTIKKLGDGKSTIYNIDDDGVVEDISEE